MTREILQTITVVDARDIPDEVSDYLTEQDISTHYQNDIAQVEDDGNPFAEWLKENGYVFKYPTDDKLILPSGSKYNQFDEIGILAT